MRTVGKDLYQAAGWKVIKIGEFLNLLCSKIFNFYSIQFIVMA